MKRYVINYISGASGFGWKHEVDSTDEAFKEIEELTHEFTAFVTVRDNKHKRFIYHKDSFATSPKVSMLKIMMYVNRIRTKIRKGWKRG